MTNFFSKTLPYTVFAAADTTAEVEIFVTTKDCLLGPTFLWVPTDFSGGSVNACNVSVGPNGAETTLLTNTDVFTGCAADSFTYADLATDSKTATVNANTLVVWTPVSRGTSIRAKMNASHNTNTLNAGVLTVILGVNEI